MSYLPAPFAEFERFAPAWCGATETERYNERLASSMDEMIEFHDAFFPRLEEAIDYCDKFPVDELPDDSPTSFSSSTPSSWWQCRSRSSPSRKRMRPMPFWYESRSRTRNEREVGLKRPSGHPAIPLGEDRVSPALMGAGSGYEYRPHSPY